MRTLVTGGREFSDRALVFRMLDAVHAKRPITLLIEGGATGADRLARGWAKLRGVTFKTCEANWDRYGNHAGRVRNCAMLREEKPQLVVAFQGGTGTRHMVGIADDAGVPVLKTWRHATP